MMIRALVTGKQLQSLNHLVFPHSEEELIRGACKTLAEFFPGESQHEVTLDTDWDTGEWFFLPECDGFQLVRAEKNDEVWTPARGGITIKFILDNGALGAGFPAFICVEEFK